MVSVAAANLAATPLRTSAQLLAAYDAHLDALTVAKGVQFERRRAARRFLQQHPDPQAWMSRSTPARLADLQRLRAWPFVSWCFVQRHLVPDLELLLAKPCGCGLPVEWAANDPDSAAAIAEAAAVLGWSANWLRQVRLLAASTICLHTGKRVRELDEPDFAAVLGCLDDLAAISPSARHHARTRLFGLQQACYQLGGLSAPPRQGGPVAAAPVRHAAGVAQPDIRAEVVRYVSTITTTLRPNTVIARTKALRVFFDYLAEHHPEVRRLDQIERTRHIEPYLAWARGRPWRGKNREAKTIGLTVFHQDVVDLRCFFEDIAGWGWASAPPRRLLFYGDIPRMPDALPRALTPDVYRALLSAVAGLDDVFAATGLRLLRATGMRVGELLDLELDCLLDFDRHGTWLRVPLGKLNSERVVPLEPDTVAVIDAWTAQRGRQRALPHPRDGRPTEFLFLEHGRRPTSFRLGGKASSTSTPPPTNETRRPATAHHPTPAAAHLRHRTDQRRYRATRPDGAHGARDAGDDVALRQTCLTHDPQRLPSRDGQGPRRAATPAHRRRRRPASALPGAVAARRDAQDQTRARLLRPPQSRRAVPLRQHLRAVRLLRPGPASRRRDHRPARGRARTA